MESLLSSSADKYQNDEQLELTWAMKAFHHAETYFNLLTAVEPRFLKLTQMDEIIYTSFKNTFGDLSVEKITEDTLKEPQAKEKWREFCMQFEGQVEDYNMGTLLRLDASEDISEKNTTLVPRIQFLAVEITRNREGHNSGLRAKYTSVQKKEDGSGDS